MFRARQSRRDRARRLWLPLAVLAVFLKVLTPSGFMSAPAAAGAPFALVICTGQGVLAAPPVQHGDADGHDDQTPSAPHDRCPFAASVFAAPPPHLLAWTSETFVRLTEPERASLTTLAPGRGLAAPPPARGPPGLLL